MKPKIQEPNPFRQALFEAMEAVPEREELNETSIKRNKSINKNTLIRTPTIFKGRMIEKRERRKITPRRLTTRARHQIFPADSRFTLLLVLKAWLTWRPFALESLGRLRTAG
ncbi:MAG: hypothetical protein ACFFCS_23575 [Candidatus Hodarchaeota archaeon]